MNRFISLRLILLVTYFLLSLNFLFAQCQADWQWAKGFKGPTGDDWPLAVTTDKWNNVIVACTTKTQFITIDSAYLPSADIVVTKFNPLGKLLWVKKFAGGEPHGLVADQNGNIYMAGLFWGGLVCNEFIITKYPYSDTEGFLVKISADGKALWGRKASSNDKNYPTMVYMGQGLAIDTIRNKLIFSGSFSGTKLIADNVTLSHSSFSMVSPEGFLLVYDTSGKAEWGKVIFSSVTAGSVYPLGIATDRSGNIYASGYFVQGMKIDTFTSSNNGSIGSMFCVKLNKQGKVQWLRASTKGNVRPYWMHTDLEANIYLGGEMYSFPVVIDKFSFSPNCSEAGMVIKIDSNGNFIWVRAITSMRWKGAPIFCIAVDDIGNSYGIGYFGGDSLFIDSLHLLKLSCPYSNGEPFIFKFNADGRLVWLFRPNSTNTTLDAAFGAHYYMRIGVDKQGNVFPAFGWFGYPPSPIPQKIIMGKDTIPMSGLGYNDIVIGKIRNNFTANARGERITCHGANNGTAKLYIMGGTPPYNVQWNNSSNQQVLNNLSPGWYKVTVTDANSCKFRDSIEIKEMPQLHISTTSKQDSAGLHKGEATATVSGGTPPYTYQWNDASAQKTQKATGLGKGSYKVTVTDKNGCTTDTTINITDITGIDELLERNILIYPNPVTSGRLNLEIKDVPQSGLSISIYNSVGKQIIYKDIKGKKVYYQDQFDLATKGLYLVKIEIAGVIFTKDIVVQ